MTQKALLQSAGDGSAIPAGCVGEVRQETTTANGGTNTVANTTPTAVRVLIVPAGVWDIIGYCSVSALPASPVRQLLSLGTSVANGTQAIYRSDTMYPASLTGSLTTYTPIVRFEFSSQSTIYLTMFSQGSSGNTTVDQAQIRAIRIA